MLHFIITDVMNTTKTIPSLYHVQEGVSWLGGPTHTLQKQHVPGYGGHIPTLGAENVHGKSFSRVSAECLNSRTTKGFTIEPELMYKSNYTEEFGKPDTRKSNLSFTAEKILQNLEQQQDEMNQTNRLTYESQPKSIDEVKPIDRIPVVGYQGHRPVFRPPIRVFRPPSQPKPVVLHQISHLKTMINTGSFDPNAINAPSKQVPIVGYSGFLKSVKAENMFGQTYKDLARKSIYS